MTAQGSRVKDFRSNTHIKDAEASTNYSINRQSDVYEMQQKVLQLEKKLNSTLSRKQKMNDSFYNYSDRRALSPEV